MHQSDCRSKRVQVESDAYPLQSTLVNLQEINRLAHRPCIPGRPIRPSRPGSSLIGARIVMPALAVIPARLVIPAQAGIQSRWHGARAAPATASPLPLREQARSQGER